MSWPLTSATKQKVGIEVGGLLRRAEKPAVGNEGPLTGEG